MMIQPPTLMDILIIKVDTIAPIANFPKKISRKKYK